MVRLCEVCKKEFNTRPAHVKIGWGRFCSRSCANRIVKNAKGAKRSKEYIDAMRKRMIGKNLNEEHFAWKGDKASYTAKHMWMYRHYGQPKKCDFCLTENAKKFNWANISGQYKRIRTDWFRLCQSCHFKFDNVGYRANKTRKERISHGLN